MFYSVCHSFVIFWRSHRADESEWLVVEDKVQEGRRWKREEMEEEEARGSGTRKTGQSGWLSPAASSVVVVEGPVLRGKRGTII